MINEQSSNARGIYRDSTGTVIISEASTCNAEKIVHPYLRTGHNVMLSGDLRANQMPDISGLLSPSI